MLRQLTRLSLACLVALSLCGWAAAHEHEHGASPSAIEYGYHNGYLDGFEHGREDRQAQAGYDFKSRDYHHGMRGYAPYMGSTDRYKSGYREGYVAGYNDGFYRRTARFTGPSGPPFYGDNSYQDLGPNYGQQSVAFHIGYEDGLIDGGKDQRKNKEFRPAKHDRYEDADHGYRHEYGSKHEYKRQYREGYLAGYEHGYGGFQHAWRQ